MNHYAQALAELQAAPAHELKQIGDQWQTPKALAWGLFHQFAPTLGPVVLDMFADHCNHLVPHYYTAADNALTQELADDLRFLGGAAYGNPPYSRPCVDSEGNPITGMEAILTFCREQRAQGAKIMLLIKAATSEAWWPDDADFIQFISGRIGFEVPSWYVPRDPKKDKPSSSGFASAVVIFDASWQGERRPLARLRRDDLITTGQIILDMIHQQAVALIEDSELVVAKTLSQASVKQIAPELNTQEAESSTHNATLSSELHIYQAASGQWGAKFLVNGEEVKGIGGCDTADEALEYAAECGWSWDKLILPVEVAQSAEPTSTKPLEDWAFDYRNDQLNLGGAAWHRVVTVLTVLYGELDAYTARNVAIAISLSDEQLRDQFTTMPYADRPRLERVINAMDTMEWNRQGAQRPLNDPQRQAAAGAIFAALKENSEAPKSELLDRAIAAITNLEEAVA